MTAINRDWLFQQIRMNDLYSKLEHSENLTRAYDKKYLGTSIPAQQNDYLSKYFYNGQMGCLKYSKNTSIKSDPMNEYEDGRRTILTDTTNKYGVSVSGYTFKNEDIKPKHTAKTSKLDIVGYFG